MNLYKLLPRPLLFSLPAETAHTFTLDTLALLSKSPQALAVMRELYTYPMPKLKRSLFGINFPNGLGLAAGMDKNARALPAWAALGFGFVEIGTVTPFPQIGNPKPRMFRVPKSRALINRMGFNNDGAIEVAERLKRWGKQPIVVGISIGKQKETALEDTATDHDSCLEVLYEYGDYFVLNISSPNTPGLRELQGKTFITNVLKRARAKIDALNARDGLNKPLLVKIAPDLSPPELHDILDAVRETGISGVIATNTTISNDGIDSHEDEAGGRSGAILTKVSSQMVARIRSYLPTTPIIGVGGIDSGESAARMFLRGAHLVQLYTGLVYEGPGLPNRILRHMFEEHGRY